MIPVAQATKPLLVMLVVSLGNLRSGHGALNPNSTGPLAVFSNIGVVVTDQAMGARCAVAADFDGDGRQDLVSASSNDNAVSWFRNEGRTEQGQISFSTKKQITWSSLGSRIVTVADIDGDGDMDVVGASYYDSSLRWFENDGTGQFTPHLISAAVNEGQGVTAADIDNDGDNDIITASSGDNTIAVFRNLDQGVFCEIKEVVDNNALGARTVQAADLNGDGWLDLVSASKDDDTVAWYPNDGIGKFPTKRIVSVGEESKGAYSLAVVDIDNDGDKDLVTASNGNDHVALWRNDGLGNFTKTLIFDNADFVLSVTAGDFDRDGDIDVASASFFDGHINWYENVDGDGYVWKNHTIYVGIQGHYVSVGDMDGDGDDDLIAVTHAENKVTVYLAQTVCDFEANQQPFQDCCRQGTEWNGRDCIPCAYGTYGVGNGVEAQCLPCPTDSCVISGFDALPTSCYGITGCSDVDLSIAQCSCPANHVKDPFTDACAPCLIGTIRPDIIAPRDAASIGNYSLWELEQGTCHFQTKKDFTIVVAVSITLTCFIVGCLGYYFRMRHEQRQADALWRVKEEDIVYGDRLVVLGKGSFGDVIKGNYNGRAVAVKVALPSLGAVEPDDTELDHISHTGSSTDWGSSQSSFLSRDPLRVIDKQPFLSRKKMQTMFIQDMRKLSKLHHPCITSVIGAVLGEKQLIVMEWMEHGSLRDLLSNPQFPLDHELTLPLIRDILQGTRFLHAADPPIFDIDLRCANVLVDSNFRAKLGGIGFMSRPRKPGDPSFMAPELLIGDRPSKESNIFAFGVLLWEVMTHKIPYEDLEMTCSEMFEGLVAGMLRPDCRGLDKELVECMEDCWAQDPSKRTTFQDLEIKLIPLCGQTLISVVQDHRKVADDHANLLQDVFPEHIAKKLLAGEKVEPQEHELVSISFMDIVGFTSISSQLSPVEVSDLLDRLYIRFDELAGRHGVFKLETIGDSWVGATNLIQSQEDHTARMARFLLDAVTVAKETSVHTDKPDLGTVEIRAGFHCGPVVASVVGTKNPRYCLFGDAMNTSSRMESTSQPSMIQCTEVAARLAKQQDDGLRLTYRGKTDVKGKGALKSFWITCETGANDGGNKPNEQDREPTEAGTELPSTSNLHSIPQSSLSVQDHPP